MFGFGGKATMVTPAQALPGRAAPLPGIPERHLVLRTSMHPPWPEKSAVIHLGMGCFWGAERLLWQLPGVLTTAVGYMGGYTQHPNYQEVCSGRTGHTETVLVCYDPSRLPAAELLATFWENHDPTQGMRQGNDLGTQYRSAVFWSDDEQATAVRATAAGFQQALSDRGFGTITTQLAPAETVGPFYYAEDHHQQYLEKNPHGYCPVHATGVACRTQTSSG